MGENTSREEVIVRTSIIGIAANVLLAAFKAAVGLASNSIAIILDAVNNLSDALSSVITIIGAKLAGKAPDKAHPLGYGRFEYMAELIITVIVLYAGITSLIESVKKIISPEKAEYTAVTLVIVAVAIAVKIVLGLYVKKTGKRIASGSLVASGQDALNDAIISGTTLVSAIITYTTGHSLEAYIGVLISIVIIKSGFELLRETISRLLGERIGVDLATGIKETIMKFPDVSGAYDLVLHNYGPDNYIGSVHVEVPDTYTADMIDRLTREIQREVYKEHRIILAAIGIYSENTVSERVAEMKQRVAEIVNANGQVLQMHGLYVDEENMRMSFDVIIGFNSPDRSGEYMRIVREVSAAYPEYELAVTLDADVSD